MLIFQGVLSSSNHMGQKAHQGTWADVRRNIYCPMLLINATVNDYMQASDSLLSFVAVICLSNQVSRRLAEMHVCVENERWSGWSATKTDYQVFAWQVRQNVKHCKTRWPPTLRSTMIAHDSIYVFLHSFTGIYAY